MRMIYIGLGQTPFAFDNALEFDGTDDYVSIPTTTNSSDFTLSAWFKLNSLTANQVLFSNSSDLSTIVRLNSSTEIRVSQNGGQNFTLPITLTTGVWYHFMLTSNSNQRDLFINGQASPSNSLTYSATSNYDWIGNYNGDGADTFDGVFDEISFYNSGANNQDAIDFYNSGAGQYAYDVKPSPERYYRANGSGTSTVFADEGSELSDGALNNFPTSGMWIPH